MNIIVERMYLVGGITSFRSAFGLLCNVCKRSRYRENVCYSRLFPFDIFRHWAEYNRSERQTMELSYAELKCKEIVNVKSGARMGRIVDIIFACDGSGVLGIVAPGEKKLFKATEDIFIPWKNITKIGSDVILVDIDVKTSPAVVRKKPDDNPDCGCDDGQNYL